MKKIWIIACVTFLLTGCTNRSMQYNLSLNETPVYSYEYEDVEATITKIDVRSWFAQCPRWSWSISVEYNGITYNDYGYAQGAFNRPQLIDKHIGDTITVELKTTYIDGLKEETCINKIY